MTFLSITDLAHTSKASLDESTLLKEASGLGKGKNVFLSHSTEDAALLPKIINWLKGFGASVYIDKLDSALPQFTSPSTAGILMSRIKSIPRFIMLVTHSSKNSRWVPWELGYADGIKNGRSGVALLPATTDGSEETWTKTEYLGLYPRIKTVHSKGGTSIWGVSDPADNKYWSLEEWIRGR